MPLYLLLIVSTLVTVLITIWSRRQARESIELKRQLEESKRNLIEMQASVQRTLEDVHALTGRQQAAQDEQDPPARNTVH